MKYYIIAGEASGDLHGSNLIKALKKEDKNAQIKAWGGDMMQAAGAEIRKHYRDLAFMGFLEVVKNLRTILKNMSFCKKDILDFQPDVVLFIDYPGFNLRIAKWAKKQGFKTYYYISPQIWAWHTSRVHGIKKSIDRMFCILPFEKDFYKKYDFEVDYVGHPLLDVIPSATDLVAETKLLHDTPSKTKTAATIALLPGSRKQEIEIMLPLMLSVVPYFPDYQFIIAAAGSQSLDFYENIVKNTEGSNLLESSRFSKKNVKTEAFYTLENRVKIVQNDTYNLLKTATAALVKSGTSTLETALFSVPQVVCYKGSNLSYQIAKRVVTIKYISLVNLIADKMIVHELIQDDLNTKNLTHELKKVLENQEIMKKEYEILRGILGTAGASERAAKLIIKYLGT
jgi:lipid-A-disaccharide synthase